MRVGYARVSTGEQDDALIQQVSRLEKAGAVKIYSDIKSGKSSNRNEFNKMLALCRQGKITEVVVTRVDRLARSVMAISKAIALFEEMGIKLDILDAPVEDISNPFSKFSINQMGALAQFESDLLQNRVKHGYAYFREQCKAPPQPPFGYVRVNEKYEPDMSVRECGKTNWVVAREIVDWFLSNRASVRKTIQWIHDTYGVRFSTTGFTNWLKNPTLQGHTRYNAKFNNNRPDKWDLRLDTHPALIDNQTCKEIELVLDNNKRRWGQNTKSKGTLLLSGQVVCGCCGSKCYARSRTRFFTCKKRASYGNSYCTNKKRVSVEAVCDAVDTELTKQAIALRDYALSDEPQEPPEVLELRTTLENLQRLPQNEAIDDAIAKIKIQISQHKKPVPDMALVDEWVETFSDPVFLRTIPELDRANLYRRFVRSVTILDGRVTAIVLSNI